MKLSEARDWAKKAKVKMLNGGILHRSPAAHALVRLELGLDSYEKEVANLRLALSYLGGAAFEQSATHLMRADMLARERSSEDSPAGRRSS